MRTGYPAAPTSRCACFSSGAGVRGQRSDWTCAAVEANSEQVRRGMAWVYVKYAAKGSPLYGLQREAQGIRRGLWADPQPVAPWEWRSSQRAVPLGKTW
jgi:hypothetical protein